MLNMKAVLLGLALASTQVNAHFTLSYPTTAGFDDNIESTGPCGGFTPTFTSPTDFHVGGDVIAVVSAHPEANWFFRATLDKTAQANFTNIIPEVQQQGLGAYCEQGLTLPSSFVGQQGVIQIIQSAADGNLYQCAAVNFVAGAAASAPASCKNATGIMASFMSSSTASSTGVQLATTATASAASSTAASTAASTTSATASATPKSAAAALGGERGFAGLAAVAMLGAAAFALVL